MKGLLLNIQRFSVHDGPGIRSTVFLKGCNLICFWCHNPEAIQPYSEIQFFENRCTGCGNCAAVCPVKAHKFENGKNLYIRNLCSYCGKCCESCLSKALIPCGTVLDSEEVMKELDRDKSFYDNSEGGITISGGEPLLQLDFTVEILKQCKSRGYHTAIDTAGNVPRASLKAVLPYTDLFLYDLKAFDPEKHKNATGVTNSQILKNLIWLSSSGVEIRIRIPLIPGFNDDLKELEEIARFLAELNFPVKIELLPFHKLGEGKYKTLGIEAKTSDYLLPTAKTMNCAAEIFSDRKLSVEVM